MQTMRDFWDNHTLAIIAALVVIGVVLIAAMYFGYDLSWLPDLLRDLLGAE